MRITRSNADRSLIDGKMRLDHSPGYVFLTVYQEREGQSPISWGVSLHREEINELTRYTKEHNL